MRKVINSTKRIAFSIALIGWLAFAVSAADFRVNSGDDDQSDGCGTAPNACTLREAVNAANADTVADTVTIESSVTTVTLTAGQITITNGAVSIAPATNGALVTVRGASGSRIFSVSANTTISRLLLTGGSPSTDGGAILNNGATVTINDSFITNNTPTGNGGGIYTNGGTINVNRSTIGGSSASGNTAANGGGIYNQNGTVNLTNSTISGNLASNIGGGYYGFAGVSIPPGSLIASFNSTSNTIAFNSATNGGGIAVSSPAGITSTATLDNTIVANNTASTGPDLSDNPPLAPGLSGTIRSGGYNIIGNTTGATFVIPVGTIGDQPNVNPLLLPLTTNGGLTPTHALQLSPASPAIDKGNTAQTVDQRNFTRDDDFATIINANNGNANGTDIGAFEVQIISTASDVIVGGRITTASGKSVSRVVVMLTSGSGQSRTARTNSFGYYRFKDVPSGATYIFEARSKQYTFNAKVITITEESIAVDFVANP